MIYLVCIFEKCMFKSGGLFVRMIIDCSILAPVYHLKPYLTIFFFFISITDLILMESLAYNSTIFTLSLEVTIKLSNCGILLSAKNYCCLPHCIFLIVLITKNVIFKISFYHNKSFLRFIKFVFIDKETSS